MSSGLSQCYCLAHPMNQLQTLNEPFTHLPLKGHKVLMSTQTAEGVSFLVKGLCLCVGGTLLNLTLDLNLVS